MSLILTRSPYFVSREDRDNDATIKLEIGYYEDGFNFYIEKTYNLAFRNNYLMDVSPFIRDYLGDRFIWSGSSGYSKYNRELSKYVRITVSGSKGGVAQSDVISEYYATDGYLYSTDDYNKDFSSELKAKAYYAGSTDVVYKLDDSDIEIPLVNTFNKLIADSPVADEKVYIFYKRNGIVVNRRVVTLSNEFSSSGVYIASSVGQDDNLGDTNIVSYRYRVLEDSGFYEDNKCINDFFDKFKIEDYDEVFISNESGGSHKLTVKTIEECKHKPYLVRFINRYGVYDNLWFFKRSDKSITVNKEVYRGNSIAMYSAGDGVKTMNHFNVNGKEKITLNSGFVDEEMNEAFRQLLLSEEVTLYDYKENKTYNVNLGTSELQYKQHVNEKLINYAIEFEFAHEVINNVG